MEPLPNDDDDDLNRPYIPPARQPAPIRQQPAPAPAPAPVQSFSSCKEAKAAGAAPLYVGSPGYSPSLDRDGDGVACEG